MKTAGIVATTFTTLSIAAMATGSSAQELPDHNSRALIDHYRQQANQQCRSTNVGGCVNSLQNSVTALYVQWNNSMERHLRSTDAGTILGDPAIGLHSYQLNSVCFSLTKGATFTSLKEAMNGVSNQSERCLGKIEDGLKTFDKITTHVTYEDIEYFKNIAAKMNNHVGTAEPIVH